MRQDKNHTSLWDGGLVDTNLVTMVFQSYQIYYLHHGYKYNCFSTSFYIYIWHASYLFTSSLSKSIQVYPLFNVLFLMFFLSLGGTVDWGRGATSFGLGSPGKSYNVAWHDELRFGSKDYRRFCMSCTRCDRCALSVNTFGWTEHCRSCLLMRFFLWCIASRHFLKFSTDSQLLNSQVSTHVQVLCQGNPWDDAQSPLASTSYSVYIVYMLLWKTKLVPHLFHIQQ